MAIEKLKINCKTQTRTNPQIQNHKKSHELKLNRQHKKSEHTHLKFLRPSLEKIVDLLHEFE